MHPWLSRGNVTKSDFERVHADFKVMAIVCSRTSSTITSTFYVLRTTGKDSGKHKREEQMLPGNVFLKIMFQFTIAKIRNQPNCPPMEEGTLS